MVLMKREQLEKLLQQAELQQQMQRGARRAQPQEAYSDFKASELYCPKCKCAMPVRERLLLVLPSGEKYDYTCTGCNTSVGDKVT